METMHSQDYNKIQILAEKIYTHIADKDTTGIISVMNQMNTRTEFELLCVSFYNKYKFSLYNKIWNFINTSDYKKLNATLKKVLD